MKKRSNKIFSIENVSRHKIITILGIKIKIKRKEINSINTSCYIPNYEELIAKGTIFPHPIGIVISSAATIGNNCWIYQNVTIGAKLKDLGDCSPINYPKIGNNVTIYAGAVILGNITIGDNAVIGSNSVILSDVPANTTFAGIPGKRIK